ncbi:hypothetical protein H1235_10620 [Pseudoxanthomonas sp. NC8]|nr:hypothetical protein H1235_10620 [Pseudoxanthomonas sp. NC8]
MRGIGECRWRHRAQSLQAEAGGEQVVAAAMFGDALRFDHGGSGPVGVA